ncbi:MAG: hypothetical protein Q4A63_08420, partial [Butyricicoccus pullicaecorum]|nr:hypothetical protein [Butyricicoccus pullicaecorum]
MNYFLAKGTAIPQIEIPVYPILLARKVNHLSTSFSKYQRDCSIYKSVCQSFTLLLSFYIWTNGVPTLS